MGKKPKGPSVKAKNKKFDPKDLPADKPPPLAEEVRGPSPQSHPALLPLALGMICQSKIALGYSILTF